MRWSVAVVCGLAACDPLMDGTVTIVVPAEAQAAFDDANRGQVLYTDGSSTTSKVVICGPGDELSLEVSYGGVGCAEPMDVAA
jgi:hypothetical protein